MAINKSRNGFIKIALVLGFVVCATLIAGIVLMQSSKNDSLALTNNAITFTVFQDDFINSVNEVGDIESSQNVEIRCNVKSRGRTGASILELIPEGTEVKKGDFLCQLDDSLVKDELTEQKIKVAKDKASVIQAESILDAAQRKLKEFNLGSFEQEIATLNAAITVAKENVNRSADVAKHSESLNRKGYVTKTRLQADKFAKQKAELDLKMAEQQLQVYKEFTRERIVAELEADIRKQEADLEALEYTLSLSKQRLAEREEQVISSRIVAPADGTLVYANDSERRSSSIVIEEGATIRDGQTIFFLPDQNHMQVKAKVNDSKINKVKADQRVEIRLDTAPGKIIAGKVKRVSPYPNPRRYYQAPIEYDVYIEVVEKSSFIRSGLRAKVEIFVEKIENVVQAPVSSLLLHDEKYFVLVKTGSGLIPKEVEVGSNNEKFVVISGGLSPGDEVLVDADNYRDEVEFPSAAP